MPTPPENLIPDYGPYHDYETEPCGGGNPYYKCVHCGATDPQINGTLSGHAVDCIYVIRKRAELLKNSQKPSTPDNMITLSPKQVQHLKDGINLSSIALSKLQAFIIPEANQLPARAQTQLEEIELALTRAKAAFKGKE